MNSVSIGNSEVWLPVVGYEGEYEVSSLGRIRSLDRITRTARRTARLKGRLLKTNPDTHGYLHFRLWKDGEKVNAWVHQVVLEAFDRPGRTGEEGCHDNGNKLDNRSGNLRWDTKLGNMRDRKRHGTQILGEQIKTARLTEEQVLKIRSMRGVASTTQIASEFGISRGHVSQIQTGKKWAHLNASAAGTLGVEFE